MAAHPHALTAHIALMARAPVPGQAKTRLMPALGAAGAAALATRLLHHALHQAAAAQPASLTLWATPDTTHPAFAEAAAQHNLHLRAQPAGDLGARMAAVFEHSDGLPVLLMGSDIPALDAATLRSAAAALKGHDAVFVPALDGGYGLVGLRRPGPALLAALFDGMRWSTAQVMAQTRERLAAGGWRAAELPAVSDIDEPADLAHLPADWPEYRPAATAVPLSTP